MVKYHPDLVQGSTEWLAARCGILTASQMKLIVTPPKVETRVKKDGTPYKQREAGVGDNDKIRAHLYELLAQRITGYVEPQYISDDMTRGIEDEVDARILYSENVAPVTDMGFITNDKWGFTIGFSPDGLIGDDGFLECKSRRQRFQIETIISNEMPDDYLIQIQTGFLVSGRKWCDFVSYSAGLPMVTIRVLPDPEIMGLIETAAIEFERRLTYKLEQYLEAMRNGLLIPTERKVELAMWS